MKAIEWVGLIMALVLPLQVGQAQTPAAGPPPDGGNAPPVVSPAASGVVKMAEAGTGDEVLLAYIKTSTATFDLSADEILYLRDIGLSSAVISAMLARDSELRGQPGVYNYDQRLYPPTATSAPDTTPAQAVAPAPAPEAVAAPEPAPAPAAAPEPAAAVAPPPAPVYVSTPPPEVSYFYSDLAPYGIWIQLDGVGWCWQPRVVVVNHGWRPYCDSGYWVLTDAGWFWQSDYSWGWAPFHYGRWYLHDHCGWVWMPDRVWGPAWVTWRYDGDHCGWAPLPPHAGFDAHLGYSFNGVHVALGFDFGLRPDHFTFIAMRDFNNHDFAHHRLAPVQVTQIYNHTTVINNYVVKNNTVVNQGIKVDRISAATHTQFRAVPIRDTAAWSPAMATRSTGVRAEAVYRPRLKAPARPVNMVAQKIDATHPTIQHAPVSSSKVQRPLVLNSTTGTRAYQGQNSARGSGSGVERSTTYSRPESSQRSYGIGNWPAASTRSSAWTSSAGRREWAQPAAPVAQSQQERSVSSRSGWSASSSSSANRQYYPLRSGSSWSEPSRPSAQEQNTHTYYPKGYYQAGETRMSPTMNEARPSDSRGQPSWNTHTGSPSKRPNQ